MQEGFVYVCYSKLKHLHKIGYSTKPHHRARAFGANSELILVISSSNVASYELALHRHFAAKRAYGEWFSLDQSDLDWIRLRAIYSPTLQGFTSSALTCQCHLPPFTKRKDWQEITLTSVAIETRSEPV